MFVTVGVAVAVAVFVTVGVAVRVGVFVTVGVADAAVVGVGVADAAVVGVGVAVGHFFGCPPLGTHPGGTGLGLGPMLAIVDAAAAFCGPFKSAAQTTMSKSANSIASNKRRNVFIIVTFANTQLPVQSSVERVLVQLVDRRRRGGRVVSPLSMRRDLRVNGPK